MNDNNKTCLCVSNSICCLHPSCFSWISIMDLFRLWNRHATTCWSKRKKKICIIWVRSTIPVRDFFDEASSITPVIYRNGTAYLSNDLFYCELYRFCVVFHLSPIYIYWLAKMRSHWATIYILIYYSYLIECTVQNCFHIVFFFVHIWCLHFNSSVFKVLQ